MLYVLTIEKRKPDGSQFMFSESEDKELLEARARVNNKQGLWTEEFVVQEKASCWFAAGANKLKRRTIR